MRRGYFNFIVSEWDDCGQAHNELKAEGREPGATYEWC